MTASTRHEYGVGMLLLGCAAIVLVVMEHTRDKEQDGCVVLAWIEAGLHCIARTPGAWWSG